MQIANQIENKSAGCVWIFTAFLYLGFTILICIMAISTRELFFIPVGLGTSIPMLLFIIWAIYKKVKVKKKAAIELFNQIPANGNVDLVLPTLLKFTVSPKCNFFIDNKPAQLRLIQTRRAWMNQLLAMQMETKNAQLQTELNWKYLLPGWKGNVFKFSFHWNYPSKHQYSFFLRTRVSSGLSNAFIGLTGSKLQEYKTGNEYFDPYISCYTENSKLLHQILEMEENKLLIGNILCFNHPFATKLEISSKGIFLNTILTTTKDTKRMENLINNLNQLMRIVLQVESHHETN